MVSGYVTACFKNVQKGDGPEQIGHHYQVWLCPSAKIGHGDKCGYVALESADLPKINGDLSMNIIHEVHVVAMSSADLGRYI